jgi:putative transposase
MTETGSPYDNPKAERINGIIIGEYLEGYQMTSYAEARAELKRVVELYNTDRPHMSIGYLVPEKVHQTNIQTENLWRNKRKLPPSELVNPFPDDRKPVNAKQD